MKHLIVAVIAVMFCSLTVSAQRPTETNKASPSKLSKSAYSLSKAELEKKIAEASAAEYMGSVTMDDLFLKRDRYLGKVVELKFYSSSVSTAIGENPYLFIRGKDFSFDDRLVLCGQAALEWAVEREKKGGILDGVSSTVYALVEEKYLIALGAKKKKVEEGYVYTFGGKTSSSNESESDNQVSKSSSAVDSRRMSMDEREKKIAEASSAEYKGSVTTEELILKHDQYLGKVVELKFAHGSLFSSDRDNPHLFVSGGESSAGYQYLYLCGQKALEWASTITKKSYGSSSSVFCLVEEKGLIALGTRKKKTDDGYVYNW